MYPTYRSETTSLYFSYQSMLLNTYYINLTPTNKALFEKCHAYHNKLFNDVLEILKDKLELSMATLT